MKRPKIDVLDAIARKLDGSGNQRHETGMQRI
jgi:hypothetical protein